MPNQVTNIGGVVSAITATIAYTDSTVTIATLPANSQIVSIHVDVTTAFNAATTNNITVGKNGSAAAYVTATSVGTLGRASLAATGVYSAWADTGNSEVVVTASYSQTGAAATAGAARVTVMYKAYAP